ncbi:122_t:CDS:2 [Rhizophagus irregularis]|nr:122_t:CDS:2 [Rhizophagus irregularis]
MSVIISLNPCIIQDIDDDVAGGAAKRMNVKEYKKVALDL